KRAKRSAARKRFRAGGILSAGQRHLLGTHHATAPSFLVRLGMGRGKQQGNKQWDSQHGGSSWQLWQGAWSPNPKSKAAPWQRQPQPRHASVFDGYDAVDLEAEGVIDVEQATGSGRLVPTVQGVLNETRKAEVRVQKLNIALKAGAAKWRAYEAKFKATYQKERARFLREQARLEKDIQEAEVAQTQARETLCRVATGMLQAPVEIEDTAEEALNVDSIFAGWTEEEGQEADALLRRALAGSVVRTPARSVRAVPRTPNTAASRGPEGNMHVDQEGMGADPYMYGPIPSPPGLASGGVAPHPAEGPTTPGSGQIPKHPGQRAPEVARVPTHVAPPRPGIKDAAKEATRAKQQPPKALPERLDARRQELRAATPFGLGLAGHLGLATPPHGESAAPTPETRSGGLARATIQEDDDEDDSDQEVPEGHPEQREG
ncbi:unnamed protein product, partial [Symbiodinium sp. KB8]